MKFVFQRQVPGMGSVAHWIDSKKFETKAAALSAMNMERSQQEARTHGNGGSGYTMERVQNMRVVEVIS